MIETRFAATAPRPHHAEPARFVFETVVVVVALEHGACAPERCDAGAIVVLEIEVAMGTISIAHLRAADHFTALVGAVP